MNADQHERPVPVDQSPDALVGAGGDLAERTPGDRARAERAAQGLPPTVTDPLAYRDLAVLLRTDPAQVSAA